MKRVLILGVSGSIGKNTVKIIEKYKKEFKIVGISVDKNIKYAKKLIKKHNIKNYVFNSQNIIVINNKNIKTHLECNAFLAKSIDYDIVVNALVGSIGFDSTLESIKREKIIALANKETIVAYGSIINRYLKKYSKAEIRPIDSEHSALWQLLNSVNKHEVKNLIITASGGVTFRKKTFDLNIDDILEHPIWNMGAKVTVDSSTMVNKGLEIIEASFLFNIPYDRIKVLIHPQSIVHAMIELNDGAIISHMAVPNMLLPIQYALLYPNRAETSMIKSMNFTNHTLEFYKPDKRLSIAIDLAYSVLKKGKTFTAVYSAANEVLVKRFLNGDITFKSIVNKLEKIIKMHKAPESLTINSIKKVETWAKEKAKEV